MLSLLSRNSSLSQKLHFACRRRCLSNTKARAKRRGLASPCKNTLSELVQSGRRAKISGSGVLRTFFHNMKYDPFNQPLEPEIKDYVLLILFFSPRPFTIPTLFFFSPFRVDPAQPLSPPPYPSQGHVPVHPSNPCPPLLWKSHMVSPPIVMNGRESRQPTHRQVDILLGLVAGLSYRTCRCMHAAVGAGFVLDLYRGHPTLYAALFCPSLAPRSSGVIGHLIVWRSRRSRRNLLGSIS